LKMLKTLFIRSELAKKTSLCVVTTMMVFVFAQSLSGAVEKAA